MVSKKNPVSDKNSKSRSPDKTAGRVGEARVLTEQELESRVLQVLKKQHERGLTCGEFSKKCGADWRRGLAKKLGTKRPEAGLHDVQGFIYDLWTKGLVFAEPPARGKIASRFWFMDTARNRFPLSCPLARPHPVSARPLSENDLKMAYEKFLPEHLGGFVPIYKVRRQLEAPREDFDTLLKTLNERDEPMLDLFGGDPQKFTEDQKNDSLWRRENLFLRMRWRET